MMRHAPSLPQVISSFSQMNEQAISSQSQQPKRIDVTMASYLSLVAFLNTQTSCKRTLLEQDEAGPVTLSKWVR